MKASFSPEFQALDPSLYRFPITKAPLREHCLAAPPSIDTDPRCPSSRKLTWDFEEAFLKIQDPRWLYWRTKRLKGFRGAYHWSGGELKFSVRSPEIAFFGLRTSWLCRDIPIVYWSCHSVKGETPRRYFYAGAELIDGIPAELEGKFSEIGMSRGLDLLTVGLGQSSS